MARVLVTGGAGYIGSHAVRALLEDGHHVVVLDDLSAGHVEAVPDGVPVVELAIQQRARSPTRCDSLRIDAVMHFAAWLVVADSVRDPLSFYQNNVVGSLALLGAMVDAGVKRLVFSSTCAVYGEPSSVPIVETLEKRPINAYGETKLAVERALEHVERAHGHSLDRAALFQRCRGASRRHDRRRSHAGNPRAAARHRRRDRGRAATGVRAGLSHARRHLFARLYSCV